MKAFVKLAMFGVIASALYPSVARATNIQTIFCGVHQVSVITASGVNQPMLVVSCVNSLPNTGIHYYAYPLLSTNVPVFQAFMTLLSAQMSANQITSNANHWINPVVITVDMDDTSGNNWGCGSANCRTILNIDAF
jgi:hypothetical protein